LDSKSLEEYGFKEWRPLDKLTVLGVPYKQKGVYAIRSKIPLNMNSNR
jgi:hypothetical protein